MKKIIILLFILIKCQFISLEVLASNKTIHFVTEAFYAPFESIDINNKIIGFDIDLANALCKNLNVTCTFTNQAFISLIPVLKLYHFDAIIAGIDITSERQQHVDFTNPYYHHSAIFIVMKNSKINKIELLKGKKIGVQNGTTYQKYLLEQNKDMLSIPYENNQTAFLDLENGNIDSVFGDFAVINEWCKKTHKKFIYIGKKITNPNYFGKGLGIAVRKGNKILLNKLNKALEQIKHDGTYNLIYKKWL